MTITQATFSTGLGMMQFRLQFREVSSTLDEEL